MEFVESNIELLACGEPCCNLHPPPPLWTGKSINPKCILHTLVRIMKDRISEDQIKRQIYLLEDLQTGLTCGFWLQDIANSMQLIEILLSKSEIMPDYFEYALCLIELMKFPPLMCRTNEILEYDKEVQEYFSFFGYLLVTTPKLSVRKLVIQSLSELLDGNEPIVFYSMPWEMTKTHIELSNLPVIISQYLELCSNDVYFDLIDIAWKLSKFSSTMCITLIKHGTLYAAMTRLDPNWQERLGGARPQYDSCELQLDKNYPLDDSIMLIHQLLVAYKSTTPYSDPIKKEIIPPSIEALWGLRYALHVYTLHELSKNERNFVVALWLLFIECFPDAKHVQSGIVHDFAMLACIGNKILGGTWASVVKCRHDDNDDFDFKRLMMMGLILCVDFLGADRIYQDEEVVTIMCRLLEKRTLLWNSQFHEPLKLTAMLLLQHTMNNSVDEFINCEGHLKLSNLIEELLSLDCYEDIYEMFLQSLKLTWVFIRNSLNVLSETYMDSQRKLQRTVFEKMHKYDFKTKNQTLMTHALVNIGLLKISGCAYDIEVIMRLLKRAVAPRPKDIGYLHQLIIAAIFLLWKYGMHSDVNLLYFIELKGVYLLLDLIKDAVSHVQLVCLGYLVDLLSEGTALPYLVTWQKDGVTTLSLMLDIFRKENEELGVATLQRGIIADPKFPLMGIDQRKVFENSPDETSPSITDMYFSCRPRIYAILQLLSTRYCDTLEICNEYYKTYDSNLSTDDKITKLLCDNFLSLKIGEMWMEVDACVRPIEPAPHHIYMLDTLLAHFIQWGENVQKMQKKWLTIEQKNEHYTEEEFYNLLRETKLGPAIQGLAEMKYLARTANAQFRKSSHVDVTTADKGIIETHKTIQSINNFYHAFDQKLIIQSDVIVDPFAPIPPTPVSLDNDDTPFSMGNDAMSEISLPEDISCHDIQRGAIRRTSNDAKTQKRISFLKRV